MLDLRAANCVWVSDLLARRYPPVHQQISDALGAHGIPLQIIDRTNDIWCRDYMPMQASASRFVQFRYWPTYLRDDPTLITPPEVSMAPVAGAECIGSTLIVDGGSIVHAERTAIATMRIVEDNPSHTEREMERTLCDLLELDRVVFIPPEKGDTCGHADGVLQLANDRLAVINDYSRVDPEYGAEVRGILKRAGIECAEIPYNPCDRVRDGIASAEGVYVNYLAVGDAVMCPVYSLKSDDAALAALEKTLSDSHVIPIDCRCLCDEGGAVHCCTWEIGS